MEILGFKDWFENKEKNKSVLRNSKSFLGEKINPMLWRINSKVLTLHMDESGTDIAYSANKVERYLIHEEVDNQEALIWKLRDFLVKECYSGKKAFIIGYDTSTEDSKRAFKNAKKMAEAFNHKLGLDFVSSKSFGNIEKMNDIYEKSRS